MIPAGDARVVAGAFISEQIAACTLSVADGAVKNARDGGDA